MTQTLTNHAAAVRKPKLNLLHVGCGYSRRDRLPDIFQHADWLEIRYDIDPAVKPHIVGSMTDMSSIPDGSMDAIWSSHNLEHLHSFEVPTALAEFRRVLKPTGFALISLPDMLAIAQQVVNDALDETLYQSPAGPIRPLDMIFGHQASIKAGNEFMAHRTGFTATTLGNALVEAGFDEVRIHEGSRWDLWALATMPQTSPNVFNDLAEVMR